MRTLLLLPFVFAAATQVAPAQDAAKTVCVIVHVENPAAKLSEAQVKDLFLKKDKTWERVLADAKGSFDKGEKVAPVDYQGDKACREAFLKKTLDMNADAVARHWVTVQYQSAVKPAKQINEPERVIAFVGELKGALGFVTKDKLDEAALKKVKIVCEFPL
jgi:ABC-type phosphate transport system substrate-binding protein